MTICDCCKQLCDGLGPYCPECEEEIEEELEREEEYETSL
jgi:predicted amidophosphoribosyltransferase